MIPSMMAVGMASSTTPETVVEQNSVITEASIRLVRGQAALCLTFRHRSTSQATGWLLLTEPLMTHIMRAARVDRWEDLVDKVVRTRSTDAGVLEIGHVLDDVWMRLHAKLAEHD
jgi:hypothetical protein